MCRKIIMQLLPATCIGFIVLGNSAANGAENAAREAGLVPKPVRSERNTGQLKSAQEVSANVLCPSQEKTYQFLEAVFGELADLFPGPWIHAGGDERPEGPWEQCERCRKRMKDEKLADGRFLQDRFLKRLQIFLRSRVDHLSYPTPVGSSQQPAGHDH